MTDDELGDLLAVAYEGLEIMKDQRRQVAKTLLDHAANLAPTDPLADEVIAVASALDHHHPDPFDHRATGSKKQNRTRTPRPHPGDPIEPGSDPDRLVRAILAELSPAEAER